MSPPKISIIIPFFNRIDWTLESINSVLSQIFQDFEILLVDDGTTDDISPLLAIKDPRIKIIHQRNRGPAAARNNGLRHATGDYIAFLDSDDKFQPNKLAIQLDLHEKNPNCWLSHTSFQYFNTKGDMLEVNHSGKFSGYVFPKILSGCPIGTPTVMLKRVVIDKEIWFEENYRISEDIMFWSKIAKYSEIVGIDVPYTLVRMTESTHNFSAIAQIIGSRNIVRYIRDKHPISSPEEKKAVLCKIYSYISLNYQIQKKPIPAFFYLLRSISFSSNKRERIQSLNDRYLLPPAQKLKSFVIRNVSGIKDAIKLRPFSGRIKRLYDRHIFRPPLFQRTKSFVIRNAIRIKDAIKRRLSGIQ